MPDPTSDDTWVSISDLAVRRGTSPQAVSKRVKRLVELCGLRTRRGPGGTKLVGLAEFERAVTQAEDGIRAANGGAPADENAVLPGSPILAREQARKVSAEADLRQLDLDERLGRVVPIDRVRLAVLDAAEVVGRVLDQLPSRLDDILAAVESGGTAAGRAVLRDFSREGRQAIVAAAVSRLRPAPEGSP